MKTLDVAPHPLIVGIGASAGGLAAFKTFLANMPRNPGMAFILVQHLDPHHKSLLVELLGVNSPMPVVTAADGVAVQDNCVYVIPPDATLTVAGGVLQLQSPAPERSHRRPIDSLFVSLAEDQGERAIGIVLSGVGSDGSAGIRAIKERGGLTLAQAEFDHHALSGMPDSAAATGKVDNVLPVEAMPGKLIEHLSQLNGAVENLQSPALSQDIQKHLPQITALLREGVNHDFSGYKETTLVRRLQRRIEALEFDTAEAYVHYLEKTPDEATALFREVLIGVTEFFRDPEAFEALRKLTIEPMLAAKKATGTVRVWVAGCSTGEEVYSIAILIKEALSELGDGKGPGIQIFATDIDAEALSFARAGRYRDSAAKLSPQRLQRWFKKDGNDFCAVREIRELCLFSAHSLVKDPPFSRLDLISCRNVFIYLDNELQGHITRTFHYALNPGGTLFLGPSEGIGRYSSLFTLADKKHRILQRNEAQRSSLPLYHPPQVTGQTQQSDVRAGSHVPSIDDRIDQSVRRVMEQYAPVYFVIDSNHEILRFSGGEARHFLEPSAGIASLNLFRILLKSLRASTRVAVLKAIETGETVVAQNLAVRIDGKNRDVTLVVEPIADRTAKDRGMCVVAFRDTTHSADLRVPEASQTNDSDAALQKELMSTRGQLRAASDELETTIEDMKSAAEEFQVMNEELQSSNEELETAKEEMQSINEELQTVNSELSGKNDQMLRLNSDLKNLLDSTKIAAVFLDDDLRIRHFTPALTELFPLRDTDRGRPITEIVNLINYDDLKRDVVAVQASQTIIERDVALTDQSATFLMRIRPYRTVTGTIDGVVLTFVDITQRSRDDDVKLMLAKELQHRTGNLIAVILSIANRTLSGDRPIEVARDILAARLMALARAHALLTVDASEGASLEEIVRTALLSFSDRATITGPRIILTPAATQGFALIIHELATNASKHGSLSNATGWVDITWSRHAGEGDCPWMSFRWKETGGPLVTPPTRSGFGSKLLERAVSTADHPARINYAPGGLTYELDVPLSSVAPLGWPALSTGEAGH